MAEKKYIPREKRNINLQDLQILKQIALEERFGDFENDEKFVEDIRKYGSIGGHTI